MRDWSKFAWKRGDVLINNSGFKVLFDKWTNDVYTGFYAKIDRLGNSTYYDTNRYTLAPEDEAASYIKIIEDKYKGKLNRETLGIEKALPEFNDGDIVYAKSNAFHYPSIHILNINGDTKRYYARLVINGRYDEAVDYDIPAFDEDNPNRLRYAREDEKKEIVDLKPKVELKPFDKVLVRDDEDHAWQVSLFGYKDATNYRCNNGCSWNQCIPYFGNENLLGTTKDVEG